MLPLAIAQHDLECATQTVERERAILANLTHQQQGYIRRFLLAGGSEVAAAGITGLSRPTIRKIAGKLTPAQRGPLPDPDQAALPGV